MIPLRISVSNLDRLRANFAKAPSLALGYLSKATKAAIFEVEKQAIDDNFQFRTPRAARSGYLSLSFAYGRSFSASGLQGAIGPTAFYAPYVYFGTRHGLRPNPYMDRIATAAVPAITGHFEKAVEMLAADIAKV